MDELVRPPRTVVVDVVRSGADWIAVSDQIEGFLVVRATPEAAKESAREDLAGWLDPAVMLEFRVAAAFTPAGGIDGIPLFAHACSRYRDAAYVSAAPSAEGDPYAVPGCGCRPSVMNGAS